jgi:hypothetical protein
MNRRNNTVIQKAGALTLLVASALLLTTCTKEEVSTYDTSQCSLNIWVGTSSGAVYETTTYNYSYAYEEGSVTFYAQISGMPSPHDRIFHLEAYGESLPLMASTIRTEDYVIPAGSIGGAYEVHLNTQLLADPNLFTDADGRISFRVVPDDVFSIGTEGHQSFTVILKNYLAKPDNWDTANYPQRPLSALFGAYSRVKYQFMIEHLKLIDFKISYFAQTSYDEETNIVSSAYAIHLQQVMQRALNDYNETHETPLTDEFGIPVTF